MTVQQNRYFIGQRVRWKESPYWKAGTGRVECIYLGTNDRMTYRVERDEVKPLSNLRELLHEEELEADDEVRPL